MSQLTIGEIARQAGMRPSAIRYYESLGLLPAPARVSGHRRYDPTIVYWLRFIQVAQWAGCSLDELRSLLHDDSTDHLALEAWETLVDRKLNEIEALIARAQAMKTLLERSRSCGCVRLEDCIVVSETPWAGEEREQA